MSGAARNVTFTPLAGDRLELKRSRDAIPTSLVIDNTCRVYITQIPLERIERDGANALRAEFEAFGPVESYKMFTEKSGRFIGSVLCTYRNPADASMAVQKMDGMAVDSSVLKVSLSRDHGVVLLHQSGGKGRRGFDNDDDDGDDDGDGKWKHDRYHAIIAGAGDDEATTGTHGYRRGGRGGRGGYGGRGAGRGGRVGSVEDAFERYIATRDKELMAKEGNVYSSNNNNNNDDTNARSGSGDGAVDGGVAPAKDLDRVGDAAVAPAPVGGSHEAENEEA